MEDNSIHYNKKSNMHDRDEYKKAAPIYDLLFSRALSSIRRNICTFLINQKATNILDLCCGTGEQLRLLSHNNMDLTGIDLSPAMLAEARRKSPSFINYLETDAADIQLPDNKYDGIIVTLALHEKSSRQREAIFEEACRLLKHNGHMIIADYCTPSPLLSSQVFGKMLIPTIERAAGSDHYQNYKNWMSIGGIEGFLHKKNPGILNLVASHFRSNIHVIAASDNIFPDGTSDVPDKHDCKENSQ
jgi:ubiquinone/menaquinone biosynthesis C-methylase UbiE